MGLGGLGYGGGCFGSCGGIGSTGVTGGIKGIVLGGILIWAEAADIRGLCGERGAIKYSPQAVGKVVTTSNNFLQDLHIFILYSLYGIQSFASSLI